MSVAKWYMDKQLHTQRIGVENAKSEGLNLPDWLEGKRNKGRPSGGQQYHNATRRVN